MAIYMFHRFWSGFDSVPIEADSFEEAWEKFGQTERTAPLSKVELVETAERWFQADSLDFKENE